MPAVHLCDLAEMHYFLLVFHYRERIFLYHYPVMASRIANQKANGIGRNKGEYEQYKPRAFHLYVKRYYTEGEEDGVDNDLPEQEELCQISEGKWRCGTGAHRFEVDCKLRDDKENINGNASVNKDIGIGNCYFVNEIINEYQHQQRK